MDFVLDNKISIDSILTAILAIVFIIQTAYLIRQTNVGVRSNQANILETWVRELEDVKIDLLIRKTKDAIPDENEFKKLVKVFNRMRPLFRSKLLKPSDFAYTFIVLDAATKNQTLRKTETYKQEYLILQHIYSHFNKDYDMVNYMFDLPKASWYDKVFQEIPVLKSHQNIRNQVFNNWTMFQRALKISVMFGSIILRKPIFRLDPPL